MLRNSTARAAPLLRILREQRREFKAVLPLVKERAGVLTPTSLAQRIHKETHEYARRAEHLQRQVLRRAVHRCLIGATEDLCDFLVAQLTDYPQIMDGAVVGATAHSLSLAQESLWNNGWMSYHYDLLLDHLWHLAEVHAPQMSATDAGSMLFAFYAFRNVLSTIKKKKDSSTQNAQGKEKHLPLAQQLMERFVEDIEMGTGQDALSTLMGMAAFPHCDPILTEKIIAHHIVPQIPIANHEILSHIAWTIGHLNPDNATKVLNPLAKRFFGLRDVEYVQMSIDTFANLLSGLAQSQHTSGYLLSSRMIRFLERTALHPWKPATIVRLATSVARFDAHTPSFIGKILRETIRSGRFFSPPEVQQFKEAIDEMNIEPADQIWECLAQAHPTSF